MRRLATYYNDAVRPEDPYEFAGLLKDQPLLAAQRNAALGVLAKVLSSSLAIFNRTGRVQHTVPTRERGFPVEPVTHGGLGKIPAPSGERQDRRSLRCAFSTILSIVSRRRRASTSTILTLPASPKNGQTRTKETPTNRPDKAIETEPELWLDRYGDLLFRDAMVRLGDRAAASDAVQETLLAALQAVREGRFDGRVEFRHWLRAILRNKAVDQIRRRARERPFDTSDPEGIGDTLLYKLTGLPTTSPENWAFDLETAFEREEFWGAFESCMSGLSDVQRSVFTMKVIDGVSTDEVCNILNINANNMGVLLHRGRQALKRCLESRWFVAD